MAEKTKISFTQDGIKYTDIPASKHSDNTYYIGLSGTATMIRQFLNDKYKIYGRDKVWIRSDSFANGDSIDVYINKLDSVLFEKVSLSLKNKFQEGYFNSMYDSYTSTKSDEATDEGFKIFYGSKYVKVKNAPPFDKSDTPPADWSNLSKKTQKVLTLPPKIQNQNVSPSFQKSYPVGDIIRECAGWVIYKKTLPDGRIVYNARIKPDTPKNKTDWKTITNDIYLQTGFKWGKFNAFEKWGQIASEQLVIIHLCDILSKYYQTVSPTTIPSTEPIDKGIWVRIPPTSVSSTPPSTSPPTKKEIQEAIDALMILADIGNTDAQNAILALETLL